MIDISYLRILLRMRSVLISSTFHVSLLAIEKLFYQMHLLILQMCLSLSRHAAQRGRIISLLSLSFLFGKYCFVPSPFRVCRVVPCLLFLLLTVLCSPPTLLFYLQQIMSLIQDGLIRLFLCSSNSHLLTTFLWHLLKI